MLDRFLNTIKKIIPSSIFSFFQPAYHYTLSLLAATVYRFPASKIHVTFITGTKGKTTTTELLAAMLRASGRKVAYTSTIHFGLGENIKRNKTKMGTPGRFFMQKFLREAVDSGCTHAVIEMTSQAVVQYRHKWIAPDALIFTGIHPEHIEAHGSFENYLNAKLELAKALEKSGKSHRVIVANADDENGAAFLRVSVEQSAPVHKKSVAPHFAREDGVELKFAGEFLKSPLRGEFNIMNIALAATAAKAIGAEVSAIRDAVAGLKQVEGRMEFITVPDRDYPFEVVVDYAHTTGSLEAVYQSFPEMRKICVLGNTGGGRDTWKRPEMAKIAESYCDKIILTNEDPYDEDPEKIIAEMESAITDKDKVETIIDRREAIRRAVTFADEACQLDKGGKKRCVVIITGKGTDPFIMEASGKKTPWSDKDVTSEELAKLPK